MPRLRCLCFVGDTDPDSWLTLLSVLTPTESTTAILPGLREILFSRSGSEEVPECTNEHYTQLRDFVSARKGTLTRLGIPRMENMDILEPLKDHVAQFEVRFYATSLLCGLLHIASVRSWNKVRTRCFNCNRQI